MGDENKIYVGGLATETTSESLRAHFSKFGEITDCIVMPDKVTGRSRCFGFITFKDTGSMNAALGTANLVDGREVACKKAVREGPSQSQCEGPYNVLKVFVGGLPASCDYDKFTSYFGRFGQIEDAVVMMDSQTQRHRGFGYVTYSESSAVEAALQSYAANQIDGKWVEVKRCIPQDRMSPGQSFKGKGKASVANVASVPTMPTMPTMPNVPNVPNVPNIPNVPNVPNVAGVANAPDVAKAAPNEALPNAGLMGAAAPPTITQAQSCGYGAAYAPYSSSPAQGSREAGVAGAAGVPADIYAASGYGCGGCGYGTPGYAPSYGGYCAAYGYGAGTYNAPQPRYAAYRPSPY